MGFGQNLGDAGTRLEAMQHSDVGNCAELGEAGGITRPDVVEADALAEPVAYTRNRLEHQRWHLEEIETAGERNPEAFAGKGRRLEYRSVHPGRLRLYL